MSYYYEPCKFGHVFLWSGNSSNSDSEPPEGTLCACGLTSYHRKEKELDIKFCACKVFIPSYVNTATVKCGVCGKPQNNGGMYDVSYL